MHTLQQTYQEQHLTPLHKYTLHIRTRIHEHIHTLQKTCQDQHLAIEHLHSELKRLQTDDKNVLAQRLLEHLKRLQDELKRLQTSSDDKHATIELLQRELIRFKTSANACNTDKRDSHAHNEKSVGASDCHLEASKDVILYKNECVRLSEQVRKLTEQLQVCLLPKLVCVCVCVYDFCLRQQ
jgi:hypothetical protein